ncbi:hypothetical protein O7605_11045 [Verrucosispora sp. WMMA2121]|uniref:hypothetical protein n=1 Tax=Verrucosispora sp. WMMA2121 TaxID=3015164 RepID=UPI0022B67AE2|nr:hypothetical protein [Verrucosispora sp. WMMA2121]MCZ7420054.1 hypothetical protein [Verrucosispora sp. WMMA2121]
MEDIGDSQTFDRARAQMSQIYASLFTFVGTLLVIAVGFWQWRRAQAREKSKDYRAKRVEYLSKVWTKLSEVEDSFRQRARFGVGPIPLGVEERREVNLLLIDAAPFLLRDEREWALSIVEEIIEISTLILHAKARPDWWYSSMELPEATSTSAITAQRLQCFRQQLGERYAAVTRGLHE